MLPAKNTVTEVIFTVFHQTTNRKHTRNVYHENEVPAGWVTGLGLQNSVLTHPISSTCIPKCIYEIPKPTGMNCYQPTSGAKG